MKSPLVGPTDRVLVWLAFTGRVDRLVWGGCGLSQDIQRWIGNASFRKHARRFDTLARVGDPGVGLRVYKYGNQLTGSQNEGRWPDRPC